jgi:hypothetical protein
MAKLIADNLELLLYLEGKLHITILGGINITMMFVVYTERCHEDFVFGLAMPVVIM